MTTAMLFSAGFSINNAAYGQQVVDNANRTVSLNSAPENEVIVAIPAPSAEDFTPETEQQAGTKEKVLESSDESNDNAAGGKLEPAEIQTDKVSESDQTREDRPAQVSENEEKEANSDAREEENNNDNDDIPFVLPFP